MLEESLKEKLKRCKKLSFDDVDIKDLEEISDINFSKKQDNRDKIIDFIKSSKNPYMFKCNGLKVKIEFSNTNEKSENKLTEVIKNIYK